MFMLLWLPFACIFVGMASQMGRLGVQLAAWVDRFLPGLFTPGSSGLSLLSSVSLTVTIVMSALAMLLIFGSSAVAGLQNRRLLQNGRQASATIVSATATGTYINNNPMVRFMLEVQPPDRSPFHAEAERLVQQMQIPTLQPGASVQVRYDPDTQEVAIEG